MLITNLYKITPDIFKDKIHLVDFALQTKGDPMAANLTPGSFEELYEQTFKHQQQWHIISEMGGEGVGDFERVTKMLFSALFQKLHINYYISV